MRTMSKSMVLVAALAVAAGCGGKKNDAAKAADAAATAAPSAKPMPPRMPGVRRAVAPIAYEDVKDLLPTLDGARVLKATGKAQVGERVEAAYCYDKGELKTIADQIRAKLTAAGWPEIRVRENPQVPDRIGFTGHKPPYILTGTVQRGMLPDCLKTKGQAYVSVGVHKIEMREGGPPGPIPGMRAPMVPGAPAAPGAAPVPVTPVSPPDQTAPKVP